MSGKSLTASQKVKSKSAFLQTQKEEKHNMYAIIFDLDTDTLQKSYPTPFWNKAYTDIRKILEGYGFEWQQSNVYFGNNNVNAVTCVLAIMDCSRNFPWFSTSVRCIRMFRVEEFNDLMPAIRQAVEQK